MADEGRVSRSSGVPSVRYRVGLTMAWTGTIILLGLLGCFLSPLVYLLVSGAPWASRHPPSEETYLYQIAAALNCYAMDWGNHLPVVGGRRTLADALCPDYFCTRADLEDALGKIPKGDAYVYVRAVSGKKLVDLPEGQPIIVRSGELPEGRDDLGFEYLVMNESGEACARMRRPPDPESKGGAPQR